MCRCDHRPAAIGPERRERSDSDQPRARQVGVPLVVARLVGTAVLLAVTAVDAAVSALLGTRPVTLQARGAYRLARDHYRWARESDVIDAEVIDEFEGDVRR